MPAEQPTIQSGLDAAAYGDTVLVACGLYFEHDIELKNGVTLRGESGDPDCVTVDAQAQGRVFFCLAADAGTRVEGLTLSNGFQGPGGGPGGGAACWAASPRFSRCRFLNNRAAHGGGAISLDDCVSLLEHCRFEGNSGGDGGALLCSGSTQVEVEACVFATNRADQRGGALFVPSGSLTLSGGTLVGNGAPSGGGLYFTADASLVLERSIIAFCFAGEGIYRYDEPSRFTDYSITCTDLFGNAGGAYGGQIPDQTSVNGNIAADPRFCVPELGDFRLHEESPCLPQNNDCQQLMGAEGQGCAGPTGVTEGSIQERGPIAFLRNSPNPFNPRTTIRFRLEKPARVALTIHATSGRRVNQLLSRRMLAAGDHGVEWLGCDDRGRALPSGVYHARLEAEDGRAFIRMNLIK